MGGSGPDLVRGLSVDTSGVVTVAGWTYSTTFPTTSGAYDTTNNRGDAFVSRLDPSKTGAAQLVYSTFLGGSGLDDAHALSVDASGVATVAGYTDASDFPTTSGAYDTTHNGGMLDLFVSRLDPSKTGSAQLIYSTFLGGSGPDSATALSVVASRIVFVAGDTRSSDFPTTSGAYDTTYNGSPSHTVIGGDAFVSRLDLSQTGPAQLAYSTFLGGAGRDTASALCVATSGVVMVAGETSSPTFPTTSGAYNRTYLPGHHPEQTNHFVSSLIPHNIGSAGLIYSTFLWESRRWCRAVVSGDASGIVTVVGATASSTFPATPGAYQTTHKSHITLLVSRLDPSKTGTAQLVYSTFLGDKSWDYPSALAVDASGVVTVAGSAASSTFPTTSGAYDTSFNGGTGDVFVSRLDMGVAMYGDVHKIPIKAGGTQRLTVNAGKKHANRRYWIFGSVTGTKPGLNLLGVHIPLNPDLYTDVAFAAVNTTVFTNFRGILDANGLATASFNVPANLPCPSGFTFYHAYVVYDAGGKFHMASNAVPLRLVNWGRAAE